MNKAKTATWKQIKASKTTDIFFRLLRKQEKKNVLPECVTSIFSRAAKLTWRRAQVPLSEMLLELQPLLGSSCPHKARCDWLHFLLRLPGHCASLSAGKLVSTILAAARANLWLWLLHALLVILIVTIITFLISVSVGLIVIASVH